MNQLSKNPPKPDMMDVLGYAVGSLEYCVTVVRLCKR